MSNKMQVSMKLDQRLMMSQQLRQAITLLQYNTLDLKLLVKTYLETNPLLEVDEEGIDSEDQSDYSESDRTQSATLSADFSRRGVTHEDESSLENYAVPITLADHLLEQTLLCQFHSVEQDIAERIIGSLDDDGYLTMSIEDIHKTISPAVEIDLVKNILKIIQTFDPVGVGSQDIRESLLVQLDFLPLHDKKWELARDIICNHIEMLASHDVKKLVKKLKVTARRYSRDSRLPHLAVIFNSFDF